jgi:hypothetical protein
MSGTYGVSMGRHARTASRQWLSVSPGLVVGRPARSTEIATATLSSTFSHGPDGAVDGLIGRYLKKRSGERTLITATEAERDAELGLNEP